MTGPDAPHVIPVVLAGGVEERPGGAADTLFGIDRADTGDLSIDGESTKLSSPRAAIALQLRQLAE